MIEISPKTALIIIVPLFRSPQLIAPLVDSLVSVSDEIRKQRALILFINDSPDDEDLNLELDRNLVRLDNLCVHKTISNAANIGFIRSTNLGLSLARDYGCDALLLNSDALLTKGAIKTIIEAAYSDPLIGFVSPRSNNATICNSPYPDAFRSLGKHEAHQAHTNLSMYLDDITYVPTVVGFCLYIKHQIIKEFGILSEAYGHGYNEENDLIFRCNQAGYRAALANKAFVYHEGSISFDNTGSGRNEREIINRSILDRAYPEYGRSITRYFNSIEYLAQYLTAGLLKDNDSKLAINFDCENIGSYYNGTFEHAISLIKAFSNEYNDIYSIYVTANKEAISFHKINEINNISVLTSGSDRRPLIAINFRVGQPFSWQQLTHMTSTAPLSGYLMLDTIALDCMHLDSVGLEQIWAQMLNMANIFVFNSEFSRSQFAKRFNHHRTKDFYVSLCSTDINEYGISDAYVAKTSDKSDKDPYILVVGNKFPHKNVDCAVQLLSTLKVKPKVIVLGKEIESRDGINGVASGSIDQNEIDILYKNAALILFPTHYEGFGLPIMRALACKVPVVSRTMPVFEEIKRRTTYGVNVHLFDTTEDMIDFAIKLPNWIEVEEPFVQVQSWKDAAVDLQTAIKRAFDDFTILDLKRRLESVELCRNWLVANREVDLKRTSIRNEKNNERQTYPNFAEETQCIRDSWHNYRNNYNNQTVLTEETLLSNNKLLRQFLRGNSKISSIAIDKRISFREDKFLYSWLLELGNNIESGHNLTANLSKNAIGNFIYKRCEINIRKIILAAANAGFVVTRFLEFNDNIVVTFNRRYAWLDNIDLKGSDEDFILSLYIYALKRTPDLNSKTWIRTLSQGRDRSQVAKSIMSSKERIELLAMSHSQQNL